MCGIVGAWTNIERLDRQAIELMIKGVEGRGPDSQGSWVSKDDNIVFGHARLAILDLSSAGQQPMTSKCGRYTIVYNGEIYNHLELRCDHFKGKNIKWRGSSDTETLIELISLLGLASALRELNGMFAFGLWDNEKKQLTLARDRVGEKPLYYGINSGVFLFSSELKGITAFSKWKGKICKNALSAYMYYRNVPAPLSIYEGIFKLLPGHYVSVGGNGSVVFDPVNFWNMKNIIIESKEVRYVNEDEYVEDLNNLLLDSVEKRLMSDVTVGALLSGGVDSSTVVSLMSEVSSRKVNTFTIGFSEDCYDEADHARGIAEYLGTEHEELYLTSRDALEIIPSIPRVWDEPFSDASQIPTLIVSNLARGHVKVCLSGDGGDELFWGYDHYLYSCRFESVVEKVPWVFRDWLSRLCRGVLESFPEEKSKIKSLSRFFDLLESKDAYQFCSRLMYNWRRDAAVVLGGRGLEEPDFKITNNLLDNLRYEDFSTRLPNGYLVKTDRAAMAVGLEARVPLLDHRVVEMAFKAPMSRQCIRKEIKWPLKGVLSKYVPRDLFDRPKQGFCLPVAEWLRGGLRGWAEALIEPVRLQGQGYLDEKVVSLIWNRFLAGDRKAYSHIWGVLMFQSWLEEHRESVM